MAESPKALTMDEVDPDNIEEASTDSNGSNNESSTSESEDEELRQIQMQIEMAKQEKAEREQKLKAQQEQVEQIRLTREKADAESAKREKSARKKQEKLQQLQELEQFNKNSEKKESEARHLLSQWKSMTKDSGIADMRDMKKQKGTDTCYTDLIQSEEEEPLKRSAKTKNRNRKVEEVTRGKNGEEKQRKLAFIKRKQKELAQLIQEMERESSNEDDSEDLESDDLQTRDQNDVDVRHKRKEPKSGKLQSKMTRNRKNMRDCSLEESSDSDAIEERKHKSKSSKHKKKHRKSSPYDGRDKRAKHHKKHKPKSSKASRKYQESSSEGSSDSDVPRNTPKVSQQKRHETSSEDSDDSDTTLAANLNQMLKLEKMKAKRLKDQKAAKRHEIQSKMEELERLQHDNCKAETKLKATDTTTKKGDAGVYEEIDSREKKMLESMAKAEEEQNKRLEQQKKNDIKLLEMKNRLEDLKRDNRDRLHETIKTASETKLLEDTINSELYDAEKIKLRRKEIAQLMRLIKKAQVVDLCFLVDATGSMGAYIKEVKESIRSLARELSSKHESLQLNLAFVAYRDHCDAGTSYGQFQILDFTKSVEEFEDFVGSVSANGGGDGPEDIFGGFQKVLSLTWTAPTTRVVMHIADAPCHGSRFHSMHDDYPAGDPHGYTAEDLLPKLQKQANIFTFMFFKLNEHVNQMISEFQSILGSNSDWLKVYPLKSMNVLMETVSHTISASISTVESSTMSSFLSGRATSTKKEFTLDTKIPTTADWSAIPSKHYHCDSYVLPSIDAVTESKISSVLTSSLKLQSHEGSIKIAPNPFAKGALRIAYHAINKLESDSVSVFSEKCVVKDYIEMKVRENALKKHLSEQETQAVASFLANCFNRVKPKGAKEIFFLQTEVLKMDGDSGVCLSKEPWISGDYKKFNNNWGWVDEADYSASIQAFSHWTYDISSQFLIVVDLQGKKSNSTFLLTDPVIHCKDLIRFGRTNLGPTGVSKFFKTHTCSHVCKAMGLRLQTDQPRGKEAPKSSTVLC